MDLQLEGRGAIITGGSRGIGKAIAAALAAEGVDVVLAARTEAPLVATAEEIAQASGRRAIPIVCDTGDDAAVRRMVDRAAAELGRIDILVNNAAKAAGQSAPPTLDTLDEVFWEDMNVKVLGYIRCARAVAPHMRERGWGRIINISGLAARQSAAVVGSIRNVAVAAMAKNLADTLGRDGINVTVVHPGLTVTEATPGVLAARAESSGRPIEEIRAEMFGSNAVRRPIDASDVANVVAFLASPLSVAISGDAIAVGGGV
ncbi:MAG: SDR family oxidoreductase, partial [Chloroflexi bacterium]|nr:SDR family oxidoreductase [Chloroflexota bacterium]